MLLALGVPGLAGASLRVRMYGVIHVSPTRDRRTRR